MPRQQRWCQGCRDWMARGQVCSNCQRLLFEAEGQAPMFVPGEVETSPLARKEHPSTSHESAGELRASEKLALLHEQAVKLVRKFPGLGANEYSYIATGNWESQRYPRRLPELRDCRKPAPGYLFNHGKKKCPHSHMNVMRWYPIEMFDRIIAPDVINAPRRKPNWMEREY